MCECEAIVNGRPITTVSNDPADLNPITPNSLLLMKDETSLPPGLFEERDCYSRKRWRQVQYLANIFWKRWKREYLPLLQPRSKWNKIKSNLQENDVVLVMDESLPRNKWTLGRIKRVYPDQKGLVRSADIRTQYSVIKRPITKLVLLLSEH